MAERGRKSGAAHTHALAAELRVVLGALVRRLREQSHPGDFTSSQKSLILRLERNGPATVTALARAEGVRPQSLGATVSALEALGILYASPDPADGRRTLLALTDRCRETMQASRLAKEDWLQRALQAKLTAEEQKQLAATVQLLQRLAES